MFGGVLNSLTKKLGQTATRGEAGKLASLVGGEGAIAKSAPKTTGNIFDKLGITKSLDNDLPIYHGTSIDNANSIASGGLVFDPAMRNNLTGMGNYGVSTSLDEAVARKYAQQYGNKDVLRGSIPKGTKVLDIDSGGYGVDDYLTHNQLKELQDAGYGAVIDRSAGQEQEARLLMDFLRSNSDEVVPKVMPKNSFTGKVDMTPDDINMFREDIKNALYEGGFDDVAIDSLDHIGSTRLGTARPDSDLDLVMRYKGDAREDDVFNLLNDYVEQNGLEFNGRKVDINPIRSDDIEQYRQLLTDAGVNIDDVAPYLSGDGVGNDLLRYMNATNTEFVAKKNLGAKTKTPAPRGRPTNEIRDSIAGTKIHPEDMDAMDEFIRYARNKKLRNSLPDDRQAKYEMRMYDMADHYGIKLNENATDPIRDMANRFIKAMDKQNLGGK